METERPRGFKEFIGVTKSWNELGMRIKSTFPVVPGEHKINATTFRALEVNKYDPVVLKVCLECKKPVPIREVTAWVWTHMFHADNPEGIFRETQLMYDENSRKWDDNGVTTYEFEGRLFPTKVQEVRMTFNVKYGNYMIWVNKYQRDIIINVNPERPNSELVNVDHQTQITKKITIGNYMALLTADEMYYSIGVNLEPLSKEDESKLPRSNFLEIVQLGGETADPQTNNIDHKPVSIFEKDKSSHGDELSPNKLAEIVNVLQDLNKTKNQILMCDTYGLGKVGSAMTAYIYCNNPNLSYEEAHEYVRKRKPTIYCHKGLRNIVSVRYPRD